LGRSCLAPDCLDMATSVEPSPEDLLTRIARHDERALAEFYDRFAPLFRGIAARILTSAEAAEEVLREVFLRVWTRVDRESQPEDASLVEMVLNVRNLSVRRRREMKSLPSLSTLATDARLPERCVPQPRDIAFVSTRQELLRTVLSQLPAAQKKVLELCLLEGYTEEEIAQVLNQPLGRVRDQIRASFGFARQRLQILMGTWTADI
jgi:RNA polymerase sigma-70 factor, ECF subfamily